MRKILSLVKHIIYVKPCGWCGGSGILNGEECHYCGGTGEI